MHDSVTLFRDNFDKLPVGMFSADVGPLTEYHYLDSAAPKEGWSVAAFGSGPAGKAWHIAKLDGRNVMRQTFQNDKRHTHPMVAAGDVAWEDYSVETTFIAPATERCGLVVRYVTNRMYYFCGLDNGRVVIMRVNDEKAFQDPDETILAESAVTVTAGARITLAAAVRGDSITLTVDGVRSAPVTLAATDGRFPNGKIGLLADGPADFLSVRVTTDEKSAQSVADKKARAAAELEKLRASYPAPKVWKKIKTPGFGVGRNLRFGDLTGNGMIDILVPQVVQHGPRDAYAEVGCITAIDLDGNILWQHGESDPNNWFLTNDVGVQIHDIDGDGRNEVIYCRDHKIFIVDGATGSVKRSAVLPESRPPADKFDRILGDCLFFCDLRGIGRKGDILIKDRYWNFWVYDENLNPLWDRTIRTGHYPFAFDIDGDGHDEIAIGHSLFDHDGTMLWNNEEIVPDHTDGVAIVDMSGDGSGEPRIFYAGSDAGAYITDLKGEILKHHFIGHVQNPAVLNLRDDLPGLQIVAINFWGNQGILHFFDSEGEIYHVTEPLNMGSMCLPVNWRGDGGELFLHNTHSVNGGMFDGWGRPVVMFPDDGHPTMCNAVLDITGDCRDEIVAWNAEEIWIYTQEDSPRAGRLYKPTRNPLCNSSNYQASVSLPGWSE